MISHLHTHSCYSFLEGLAPPQALARAAAVHGMPALALADHTSLTGAIGFYRACQENGVKPILGLEVDLLLPYRLSPSPIPTTAGNASTDDSGSLVLLAMNRSGWNNLCRISSRLLTGPEGVPPFCTLDQLAQHTEGLLCLTGGMRGAVSRSLDHPEGENDTLALLGQLKEIFPERLYLEVTSPSPMDEPMRALSARLGLPRVAAHPIYYLDTAQASLQRTAAAIRCITPLTQLVDSQAAPPGASFLSPDEMTRRFAGDPQALASIDEIVERCDCELPLDQAHYPHVPLPEGITAGDLLRRKAEAGARQHYGELTPAIAQRLERELAVITARGYETIFLIAEEMIAFARQSGIPSASRGSASSSLVAHCIGATTPDPLALDLYFERFLNPARKTPPDIDTDFCSRRRDDVINHLFETYGHDQVAMVATINTFQPRSALHEVAKAHGLKPLEIRPLVNTLGHHFWRHLEESEAPEGERKKKNPYAELIARHGNNPRYLRIFKEAEALIDLPHHLSVHPGGVVIAPGPIVDYVPVARSNGKNVTITQFDLKDVESCGLVKLDLLGIRGLTVLSDVAASIYSWRRKEFRNRNALAVLESVPDDDPDTSALIASGRTIGCFQIESPGMRATLRDIQARSVPDIMAALALYRPGPLKGGLRDAFVRRYKRQEAVTHIHPALSELLRETFGVILYQEQVLRIAHELAGLSLAEADLLRRAMSHFDPGKQMQVLKQKFIEGAHQRSQVAPETGARIWEMMAAFAGYGFPKAHAASYAVVGWRSAWCKAHYPAEFIAAVLANWGGYYPQSVYLNEARRLGLSVRPPHINHSRRQFSVSYPNGDAVLYMGLDQVRGLTHRTQERIIQHRPFQNLTGFIMKVDPRLQELENLIHSGAFDGLGTIPDLLHELEAGKPRPGQLSLFSLEQPSEEDWTMDQKADAQQRLLGISMEAHPLERYAAQIETAGAISTLEAAAQVGEKVRVAGMRQTTHRSLTGQNEWMAFLTLEDLEGMLDVILFPDVYNRARNTISTVSVPLIIEGVVKRDETTGEPLLQAEKVWRVH